MESGSLMLLLGGGILILGILASALGRAVRTFSPSRLEARLHEPGIELLEEFLPNRPRFQTILGLLEGVFLLGAVAALVQGAHLADSAAGSPIPTAAAALGPLLLWSLWWVFGLGAVERRAEALMQRSFKALRLLDQALAPVSGPVHRLRLWASGVPAGERSGATIAEEIRTVVDEGEREGILREEEKEMIKGVIELNDVDVAEIMTPRTDMVAIPATATVREGMELALECGYSRIPVFEKTRDRIVGVLYAKDLLERNSEEGWADRPIVKLMRKASFVPETKRVLELLREFKEEKVHVALVTDEYGGTAGLVTIEDVLEEIVGEITDEYDPEGEAALCILTDDTAEVDGRTHIDDLNEALGTEIPEEAEYETLGGYIFYALGRVPSAGEGFERDGVSFTVLSTQERRIRRVKVVVQGTIPGAPSDAGPAVGFEQRH